MDKEVVLNSIVWTIDKQEITKRKVWNITTDEYGLWFRAQDSSGISTNYRESELFLSFSDACVYAATDYASGTAQLGLKDAIEGWKLLNEMYENDCIQRPSTNGGYIVESKYGTGFHVRAGSCLTPAASMKEAKKMNWGKHNKHGELNANK